MREEIVQVFPDGHEIRQDRWQKIVKHPATCHHAQRGGRSYARVTYLTTEVGFRNELAGCHLRFVPPSRLGVVGRNPGATPTNEEMGVNEPAGLESRPTASNQGVEPVTQETPS